MIIRGNIDNDKLNNKVVQTLFSPRNIMSIYTEIKYISPLKRRHHQERKTKNKSK